MFTSNNVFPLVYGAMPLTLDPVASVEDRDQIFSLLRNSPVQLVDTAIGYKSSKETLGENERVIRHYFQKHQIKNINIATKCGAIQENNKWIRSAHPRDLRNQWEQSAKNLNLDCIFLYQLHCKDPMVPLEDSVGELSRLKEEGKIQHIGLSNLKIEDLNILENSIEIFSLQNEMNYNLNPDLRNGVLDYCEKRSIFYLAYSVFGGWSKFKEMLSSKEVVSLGQAFDVSPSEFLLTWVISRGENVLPLAGSTKPINLKKNLEFLQSEKFQELLSSLKS